MMKTTTGILPSEELIAARNWFYIAHA